MPVPLWATLVGISVAKKITLVIAAKLYGIPRLYRRCQKGVRLTAGHPAQRNFWAGRVRASFRLPQNVARAWHGQQPIATRYSFPGPPTGAQSSAASLSFASAPLFDAPCQRMQEKLQRSRQHPSAAHARWRQPSQALKQRGWPELQRCGGQAQPSLGPAAATMQYIRHARQAFQLVPAVAMC